MQHGMQHHTVQIESKSFQDPIAQVCVIRPFDDSQRAFAFRYYARCTGAARSGFGRERQREQLCPQEMIGVPALFENPPKIELLGPT